MNKGQASFAIAGVILGFLVGFTVAHQVYVGRGGPEFQHPSMPQGAANGGMPGGAPPSAGANGAAGPGGGQSAATMEAVTQEIGSLKSLLESEPENLQALVRLGNLYFDAGMFEGAAGYYGRALEVEPGDVMVRTDLGTSLRRMGQPEKALEHFQAAVLSEPSHWRGWFNIGVVSLYDLGRFDTAEEAFIKVDELNPGSIDMTALREEIARIKSEGSGGMMARSEHQLRKDICEVGRRLYQKGFIAANDGNISIRMENGSILLTPSGMNKGRLDEEDLVVTDLDGNRLFGRKEPSSELPMHLVVYRERPDVKAVVHAHPPHATGFAVAGVPLDKPLISEVVLTLGTVPLAEYGTPTTPELADRIEPFVRDHDAILMANHGAMTAGPDIFTAYDHMETLDHFAHIWMVARILGNEVSLSPENVSKLEAIRDQVQFVPPVKECFSCPILDEKMKSANGEGVHLTRDQLVDLVADVVKNLNVV